MSLKRTLALAAALTLPLQAVAADDPMKVGFVYVGPIGDHGWSYQHDQGRKELEAHFGDKVQTTYVENVNEGADAERTIRRLAQAGNDVIFTTSFGFMNATERVAADYPDKTFLHATGYKRADNLGTYLSVTYEGRYVTGTAAGLVTESNVLGYIASFPIPEVIRDINATYLGAKAVNPDIELKVVWVNTWFDPAKEADAANTLMDQGADVIGQHVDSPTPQIVAQERGVHGTGHHRDMSEFAPEATVCSSVWVWDRFLAPELKKIMAGNWVPAEHGALLSMEQGGTDVACCGKGIDEEEKAKIMAAREELLNGEKLIYAGPIADRDGNVKAAEGEALSDAELWSMDWFVKGVITQQ